MNLFKIENVVKTYGMGNSEVIALNHINLEIPKSKFIVILGSSGSGKSTLLNMIGCMDTPTKGKIQFNDQDITKYNKSQMTKFRSKTIGFVFQRYNLLPDMSALENVEFSTELAHLPRSKAVSALEAVGLSERIHHFPAQLSGGEQQRVSIARAIAKQPEVLLCDEPTGALDYETGKKVLGVLKKIHEKQNTSVILITHNKEISKIAHQVITLRSGNIMEVTENKSPLDASEVEW